MYIEKTEIFTGEVYLSWLKSLFHLVKWWLKHHVKLFGYSSTHQLILKLFWAHFTILLTHQQTSGMNYPSVYSIFKNNSQMQSSYWVVISTVQAYWQFDRFVFTCRCPRIINCICPRIFLEANYHWTNKRQKHFGPLFYITSKFHTPIFNCPWSKWS